MASDYRCERFRLIQRHCCFVCIFELFKRYQASKAIHFLYVTAPLLGITAGPATAIIFNYLLTHGPSLAPVVLKTKTWALLCLLCVSSSSPKHYLVPRRHHDITTHKEKKNVSVLF